MPASVAWLEMRLTGDHVLAVLTPRRVGSTFVEIDREIFFVVILSLQLIQEGQLSVSSERMCSILVNWRYHLED